MSSSIEPTTIITTNPFVKPKGGNGGDDDDDVVDDGCEVIYGLIQSLENVSTPQSYELWRTMVLDQLEKYCCYNNNNDNSGGSTTNNSSTGSSTPTPTTTPTATATARQQQQQVDAEQAYRRLSIHVTQIMCLLDTIDNSSSSSSKSASGAKTKAKAKAATAKAKAKAAFRELSKIVSIVCTELDQLIIPTRTTTSASMSSYYTIANIGSVLICDNFREYTRLELCLDAIEAFQLRYCVLYDDVVLVSTMEKHTNNIDMDLDDTVLLQNTLHRFEKSMNLFCNTMSTIGLFQTMIRCRLFIEEANMMVSSATNGPNNNDDGYERPSWLSIIPSSYDFGGDDPKSCGTRSTYTTTCPTDGHHALVPEGYYSLSDGTIVPQGYKFDSTLVPDGYNFEDRLVLHEGDGDNGEGMGGGFPSRGGRPYSIVFGQKEERKTNGNSAETSSGNKVGATKSKTMSKDGTPPLAGNSSSSKSPPPPKLKAFNIKDFINRMMPTNGNKNKVDVRTNQREQRRATRNTKPDDVIEQVRASDPYLYNNKNNMARPDSSTASPNGSPKKASKVTSPTKKKAVAADSSATTFDEYLSPKKEKKKKLAGTEFSTTTFKDAMKKSPIKSPVKKKAEQAPSSLKKKNPEQMEELLNTSGPTKKDLDESPTKFTKKTSVPTELLIDSLDKGVGEGAATSEQCQQNKVPKPKLADQQTSSSSVSPKKNTKVVESKKKGADDTNHDTNEIESVQNQTNAADEDITMGPSSPGKTKQFLGKLFGRKKEAAKNQHPRGEENDYEDVDDGHMDSPSFERNESKYSYVAKNSEPRDSHKDGVSNRNLNNVTTENPALQQKTESKNSSEFGDLQNSPSPSGVIPKKKKKNTKMSAEAFKQAMKGTCKEPNVGVPVEGGAGKTSRAAVIDNEELRHADRDPSPYSYVAGRKNGSPMQDDDNDVKEQEFTSRNNHRDASEYAYVAGKKKNGNNAYDDDDEYEEPESVMPNNCRDPSPYSYVAGRKNESSMQDDDNDVEEQEFASRNNYRDASEYAYVAGKKRNGNNAKDDDQDDSDDSESVMPRNCRDPSQYAYVAGRKNESSIQDNDDHYLNKEEFVSGRDSSQYAYVAGKKKNGNDEKDDDDVQNEESESVMPRNCRDPSQYAYVAGRKNESSIQDDDDHYLNKEEFVSNRDSSQYAYVAGKKKNGNDEKDDDDVQNEESESVMPNNCRDPSQYAYVAGRKNESSIQDDDDHYLNKEEFFSNRDSSQYAYVAGKKNNINDEKYEEHDDYEEFESVMSNNCRDPSKKNVNNDDLAEGGPNIMQVEVETVISEFDDDESQRKAFGGSREIYEDYENNRSYKVVQPVQFEVETPPPGIKVALRPVQSTDEEWDERVISEPVSLRHAEQQKNVYEWQKPDWACRSSSGFEQQELPQPTEISVHHDQFEMARLPPGVQKSELSNRSSSKIESPESVQRRYRVVQPDQFDVKTPPPGIKVTLRPVRSPKAKPEVVNESVSLRHTEQNKQDYEWEKPEWAGATLKKTKKGENLKTHGDLMAGKASGTSEECEHFDDGPYMMSVVKSKFDKEQFKDKQSTKVCGRVDSGGTCSAKPDFGENSLTISIDNKDGEEYDLGMSTGNNADVCPKNMDGQENKEYSEKLPNNEVINKKKKKKTKKIDENQSKDSGSKIETVTVSEANVVVQSEELVVEDVVPQPELSPMRTRKVLRYDRATLCMYWYSRLGQPDRETMKQRITKIGPDCDVTPEEVDLLPWIARGKRIHVKEMNILMVAPPDIIEIEEEDC
jgi:hypothetical protein